VNEKQSMLGRLGATGIPLLIARLLVGGAFVYMGYMKLTDPVNFLKQINEYGMFPEGMHALMNATAIVLPYLEILCGLLMIAGLALRGAATTIALMLVAFAPALLWRAWSLYQVGGVAFCDVCFDCGCGTGVVCICNKLGSNAALFLGTMIILFSRTRRFCLAAMCCRGDAACAAKTDIPPTEQNLAAE
jgi:uncharacterized membrane protein YphA (DoxX/SURF4 family)